MSTDVEYATRDALETIDRAELLRNSLTRLETEIRDHDSEVISIMGRGLGATEYRAAIAPYEGRADRLLGERNHLRRLLAGLEGK